MIETLLAAYSDTEAWNLWGWISNLGALASLLILIWYFLKFLWSHLERLLLNPALLKFGVWVARKQLELIFLKTNGLLEEVKFSFLLRKSPSSCIAYSVNRLIKGIIVVTLGGMAYFTLPHPADLVMGSSLTGIAILRLAYLRQFLVSVWNLEAFVRTERESISKDFKRLLNLVPSASDEIKRYEEILSKLSTYVATFDKENDGDNAPVQNPDEQVTDQSNE